MPDLTITGVPATVKRDAVCAALESIGIDPTHLRHLSMDLGSIHVDVAAVDGNGKMFSDGHVNLAVCRLSIPITDD